jgi:hypothetical protein
MCIRFALFSRIKDKTFKKSFDRRERRRRRRRKRTGTAT